MQEWLPNLADRKKPLYLAIVQALGDDLRENRVTHGMKLAPQRDMAEQLGVSVGTVSRAYAEAERLGYVTAVVGRGTFITAKNKLSTAIPSSDWNFALNVPPKTGEENLIARHLADIGRDEDLSSLLGYLPHAGKAEHRAVLAPLISAKGVETSHEDIILTPGAQHSIDIALRLIANQGDPVVTECYTFSGIVAVARLSRYSLLGVELDASGMVPASLAEVLDSSGAKVVYMTPTLQTPTSTTMPLGRRHEIAEVLRTRECWLIEDDAYNFLPDVPVLPISALIPERSFYITSFAKSLSPGLRIGTLVAPEEYREKALVAMRATGWMASPIMAEVVTRLVVTGEFDLQVRAKRKEAAKRIEIANEVLGDLVVYPSTNPSYHTWVAPRDGQTIISALNQANAEGLTLIPPPTAHMARLMDPGLRLCLGSFETLAELRVGLGIVEQIMRSATDISYV